MLCPTFLSCRDASGYYRINSILIRVTASATAVTISNIVALSRMPACTVSFASKCVSVCITLDMLLLCWLALFTTYGGVQAVFDVFYKASPAFLLLSSYNAAVPYHRSFVPIRFVTDALLLAHECPSPNPGVGRCRTRSSLQSPG